MRGLTVFQRFGVLVAAVSVVFIAVSAAQIAVLRQTIYQERRTKVHDLVQAADNLRSAFEATAQASGISHEEARRRALQALQALQRRGDPAAVEQSALGPRRNSSSAHRRGPTALAP